MSTDDHDPGPPLAEVEALAHEPSGTFVDRLRRSIERRSLTSSMATLSWTVPLMILLELLDLVFSLLGGQSADKGESR